MGFFNNVGNLVNKVGGAIGDGAKFYGETWWEIYSTGVPIALDAYTGGQGGDIFQHLTGTGQQNGNVLPNLTVAGQQNGIPINPNAQYFQGATMKPIAPPQPEVKEDNTNLLILGGMGLAFMIIIAAIFWRK